MLKGSSTGALALVLLALVFVAPVLKGSSTGAPSTSAHSTSASDTGALAPVLLAPVASPVARNTGVSGNNYFQCAIGMIQYDHLELSKSKCFLYSNQPTKVDSNTCPDFVYIYHFCFRSNLASYQSFQRPREGGVRKSEKSALQPIELNFGTENRN